MEEIKKKNNIRIWRYSLFDRVMDVKQETDGVLKNVIFAQVDCAMDDKRIILESDNVVPKDERVVTEIDFSENLSKGYEGYEATSRGITFFVIWI